MKTFITCILFCLGSICLAQDSIYVSGAKKYAETLGSATGSSVLALSSDVFLVAYKDGSSTGGTIKLARVMDDSLIAFVDSVEFAPAPGPGVVRLTKLSESSFVLSFTLQDRIYIRSGEIVDQALIVLGGIRKIESGAVSHFSQVVMAGEHFIAAFYDGASEKGTCIKGTIGENLQIDVDSSYQFTDTPIPDTTLIVMDSLSKSRFVISYGAKQGEALITSMDEEGILSFGTPFSFSSDQVHELRVLGLRKSLFALVYDDDSEGKRRGTVMLGRVDATGLISYSEKFYFDGEKPSGISATKLLPYEFIISYNGGWNDWHGYLVRARVVGDSVSFQNRVMFNPEPSLSSLSPLATYDGQDFVVIYLNRNTYRGYAKLGSTIEFGRLSSLGQASEPSFSIYPNPAGEILYVQWAKPKGLHGDLSLKLIDMNGRTVLSKESESSLITLDLGGFPPGIYLIQLSNGKGVASKKVIVR